MSYRLIQLIAVPFLLAMCTSSIAEDRELYGLGNKLKKSLPKGWQMHRTPHHWILRREQPIALYYTISMPAAFSSEEARKKYVKDSLFHEDYVIVLRFGPKVSPKQYGALQAENKQAVERYEELARGVSDIAHKFDSYRPKDAEERKRVAEFKAAAAQIKRHQLPDYSLRLYSIYVETSQSWGDRIVEKEVAEECWRVHALSTAKFQKYGK